MFLRQTYLYYFPFISICSFFCVWRFLCVFSLLQIYVLSDGTECRCMYVGHIDFSTVRLWANEKAKQRQTQRWSERARTVGKTKIVWWTVKSQNVCICCGCCVAVPLAKINRNRMKCGLNRLLPLLLLRPLLVCTDPILHVCQWILVFSLFQWFPGTSFQFSFIFNFAAWKSEFFVLFKSARHWNVRTFHGFCCFVCVRCLVPWLAIVIRFWLLLPEYYLVRFSYESYEKLWLIFAKCNVEHSITCHISSRQHKWICGGEIWKK